MSENQPLKPAVSAVSSMNYLFLKTATGKVDNEYINGELDGFIRAVSSHSLQTLGAEMHAEIKKELKNGEYFKNIPIDDIRTMLNETIERITGETYPNVTEYYISLELTINRL